MNEARERLKLAQLQGAQAVGALDGSLAGGSACCAPPARALCLQEWGVVKALRESHLATVASWCLAEDISVEARWLSVESSLVLVSPNISFAGYGRPLSSPRAHLK